MNYSRLYYLPFLASGYCAVYLFATGNALPGCLMLIAATIFINQVKPLQRKRNPAKVKPELSNTRIIMYGDEVILIENNKIIEHL